MIKNKIIILVFLVLVVNVSAIGDFCQGIDEESVTNRYANEYWDVCLVTESICKEDPNSENCHDLCLVLSLIWLKKQDLYLEQESIVAAKLCLKHQEAKDNAESYFTLMRVAMWKCEETIDKIPFLSEHYSLGYISDFFTNQPLNLRLESGDWEAPFFDPLRNSCSFIFRSDQTGEARLNLNPFEEESSFSITSNGIDINTNDINCELKNLDDVESSSKLIRCYVEIPPLSSDDVCRDMTCQATISYGDLELISPEASFQIPNFKCVDYDIRGNKDENIDYVYAMIVDQPGAPSDGTYYEVCGDFKVIKESYIRSLIENSQSPDKIRESFEYADPENPGKYNDRLNIRFVTQPIQAYSTLISTQLYQSHTYPLGALGLCEDVDILGAIGGDGFWHTGGQFYEIERISELNLIRKVIKRGITFFEEQQLGKKNEIHEFGHAAFWFPEEYGGADLYFYYPIRICPEELRFNWRSEDDCISSLDDSSVYLIKEGEKKGNCRSLDRDFTWHIDDNDPMEIPGGEEFKGIQRARIQWVFENIGPLFNNKFNQIIGLIHDEEVSSDPQPVSLEGGLSDEW